MKKVKPIIVKYSADTTEVFKQVKKVRNAVAALSKQIAKLNKTRILVQAIKK